MLKSSRLEIQIKQFSLSARSKAVEQDTKLYNKSSEESFQKSSPQNAIWYIRNGGWLYWNPPDY